jgi:RHS repeat-associated protein
MIDAAGAGETRYYYHGACPGMFLAGNGLGSVIALSNIDGDIVEAYSYDVYGTPTIYTSAGADGIWRTSDDTTATVSAIGNPYMFTGRRYDAETGLYYYRARMYSPALGRFLQTDPIGYDDGMNMYTYCGNNPLRWIDPLGLTYETNRDYFVEWFTGDHTEPDRIYGPDTVETQEMMDSMGVADLRERFYEEGCEGFNDGVYTTADAYFDTIIEPTSTAFQVGGYSRATVIPNDDGTVTYTITNTSGTYSFFLHLVPNRKAASGPMTNIDQTFWWTEIYDIDKYMETINDLINSIQADIDAMKPTEQLIRQRFSKKGAR